MTKPKVSFVTGNQDKLREVQAILADTIDVVAVQIDLPELQGEPEDISREKCRLAAAQVDGPVLVEDTALGFYAMKGLPGPYIKWFLEKLGHEGLYRMLQGFGDYSAFVQCTCSFARSKTDAPVVFVGKTVGTIVPPRAGVNLGWGFRPEGFDQTYIEMPSALKNTISHRCKAFTLVKEHFQNHPDALTTE
eukprot:EG_transcript_28701